MVSTGGLDLLVEQMYVNGAFYDKKHETLHSAIKHDIKRNFAAHVHSQLQAQKFMLRFAISLNLMILEVLVRSRPQDCTLYLHVHVPHILSNGVCFKDRAILKFHSVLGGHFEEHTTFFVLGECPPCIV